MSYYIEGAKLLAASTSAVEWYKSHAHTLFQSQVIQIFIILHQLNMNKV